MIVMVKYCGGCNPRYDRVGMVTKLAEDFPAVQFIGHTNGSSVDMLLVVNGCQNQCASLDHTAAVIYMMYQQEQYLEVYAEIQTLIKRG